MFLNNKELHKSIGAFLILIGFSSVIGFLISAPCGITVLTAGILGCTIHIVTECSRYKRLQMLTFQLDALLSSGASLPICEYQEGELSILTTQIQKMTLQLKEEAEKNRSSKKFLADSLADISHQLRTPLTAMNLTVEMLHRKNLTNERRMELTLELKQLLARTDWLVETLLKLSKLDAGTIPFQKESVSARELIDRAIAPIAIPMELREQHLTISCSSETVELDPVWTAEALGNIFKNCMEHTPVGGSITARVHQTALYTQIEISDTGPGFSPEEIPHLFERFYKGSHAQENSYGIGLALARMIVVSQNGSIQAMNCPTGAKFIIKFYKQVI